MTEAMKTLIFGGAALAAVGLAVGTRSPSVGTQPPERIGKPLFPEFTDPLLAKSSKIVRFDEGPGQSQRDRSQAGPTGSGRCPRMTAIRPMPRTAFAMRRHRSST